MLPRHSLSKGSFLKEKGIWVLPQLCESVSHSFVSNSLQPHGLYSTRLLCPWASPGENTGVGCHSLLQGIFSTQGLNPGLLHCRRTLYDLSHQGSQSSGDAVAKAERVDCATAGAQARVHFHLLRCFLERTSAKSVPDDGEGSPQKCLRNTTRPRPLYTPQLRS